MVSQGFLGQLCSLEVVWRSVWIERGSDVIGQRFLSETCEVICSIFIGAGAGSGLHLPSLPVKIGVRCQGRWWPTDGFTISNAEIKTKISE